MESYGLGQVALHLTKEQEILNAKSAIWCLDRNSEINWASKSTGIKMQNLINFTAIGPKRYGFSYKMEIEAKRNSSNYSIIHQHGIWTLQSRLPILFKKSNSRIPIVVAPHGSLDSYAMKKSKLKKLIAFSLYENKNLRQANCLHAVGENEITHFRDFGLKNPIAVIPNGISLDNKVEKGDAEKFRKDFAIPINKRILLYLSRVTPKKGLPILIESISLNVDKFKDWLLVIVGDDEFGHKAELLKLINQRKLNNFIKFVGPLFDKDKLNAFYSAEIYVLPSHSEGAPVAILEALASGLPVLTTKACPWKILEAKKCGWWVEDNVVEISKALNIAIGLSKHSLKEMGKIGKKLVLNNYNWQNSAKMTIQLYEWLLGINQKPSFVVLD